MCALICSANARTHRHIYASHMDTHTCTLHTFAHTHSHTRSLLTHRSHIHTHTRTGGQRQASQPIRHSQGGTGALRFRRCVNTHGASGDSAVVHVCVQVLGNTADRAAGEACYTHTHTHTVVHMTHTHVHTHMHMQNISRHVHKQTGTHTCVHTLMHMTHTHVHMTHTRMHTHIP